VRLAGRDLAKLSRAELRRLRGREIAMIFQEPMTSLNPVLTLGYQLIETIRLHQPLDRAAARTERSRCWKRLAFRTLQDG
jgi:ABC-type microcin C transport system duplicated ATPase subunit YejF